MADPPILGPYNTALRGPTQSSTGPGRPPTNAVPDPLRAAEIESTMPPLIRSLRDRRRPIEEREWLPNLDCWKARHRRQGYRSELFNHYIPVGRQKIEKFKKKVVKQLWPAPDAFEVYPANDADPNLGFQAEAIKNYLQWRLLRCRYRSLQGQMVLSLVLYQRAVAKTYLDQRDVPGQIWPSVQAVDPFAFYVWPETATNIDAAHVLVEHSMVPFEAYAIQAQINACDPIDPRTLTKPEWPQYLIERLSRAGLTPPSDATAGANGETERDPVDLVAMTELWIRRSFRNPATGGAMAGWEQSWLVWNVPGAPLVVRLTAQPVAPYRMAVDRQLPGEHYTPPMASDMEALNVLFNDQTNMTLDATATAMFPPAVVNVNAIARVDSLVFGPRKKWLMDDINGVSWGQIPNTAAVGYQGMQSTLMMMDAFSGSSPLAEGTPTRGMPRAGFAVSNLIGLSLTDVTSMAELIEDEINTPILSDLYRLTVSGAIPLGQLVSIPGAEGVTAWRGTVQQLLGAASFRWTGTLQAQDMQVRAQRMLTLLGQIAKIYPAMLQQGWQIDFGTLFKRLWRDGLGERGADTLVTRSPIYQQFQQFMVANGIDPNTGQPMAPPPGQAPLRPGTPPPGPGGGGGAQAPAPASAEQAERQMGRQMTESAVGQMANGLGVG